MKNLPGKIYLNLNMTPQEVVETKNEDFHEATKTWEITWSEERLSEHDPEYVRKDAFIEKACKWLKSYRQDTVDGTGYIAGIVNDKTIEDFKNYMEGE